MLSFLLSFKPFSYILPFFFFCVSFLLFLFLHSFLFLTSLSFTSFFTAAQSVPSFFHVFPSLTYLYLSECMLSCIFLFLVLQSFPTVSYLLTLKWQLGGFFCLWSWWKFKTTPPSAPEDSPRHTSDSRLYISLLKHALHSGERAHSQNSVYILLLRLYKLGCLSIKFQIIRAFEFYLGSALITPHHCYIVNGTEASGRVFTWGCCWYSDTEVERRWRLCSEDNKQEDHGIIERDELEWRKYDRKLHQHHCCLAICLVLCHSPKQRLSNFLCCAVIGGEIISCLSLWRLMMK